MRKSHLLILLLSLFVGCHKPKTMAEPDKQTPPPQEPENPTDKPKEPEQPPPVEPPPPPAQDRQEFVLQQLNPDGSYDSKDHKAKAYLYEFYTVLCQSCFENSGNVNELAKSYDGLPVEVLDVGADTDDADYSQWISDTGANHPVLRDPTAILSQRYDDAIGTLLVDANFKKVWAHEGVWDDQVKEELSKQIKELLSK